jgi:hypothetical protein
MFFGVLSVRIEPARLLDRQKKPPGQQLAEGAARVRRQGESLLHFDQFHFEDKGGIRPDDRPGSPLPIG